MLLLVSFPPLARSLTQGLREEGFRVVPAALGTVLPPEEAACDVIVLDGPCRTADARELLASWSSQGLLAPVLMLTDPDPPDGLPLGPIPGERLDKPFVLADLFDCLRRLARDRPHAGS